MEILQAEIKTAVHKKKKISKKLKNDLFSKLFENNIKNLKPDLGKKLDKTQISEGKHKKLDKKAENIILSKTQYAFMTQNHFEISHDLQKNNNILKTGKENVSNKNEELRTSKNIKNAITPENTNIKQTKVTVQKANLNDLKINKTIFFHKKQISEREITQYRQTDISDTKRFKNSPAKTEEEFTIKQEQQNKKYTQLSEQKITDQKLDTREFFKQINLDNIEKSNKKEGKNTVNPSKTLHQEIKKDDIDFSVNQKSDFKIKTKNQQKTSQKVGTVKKTNDKREQNKKLEKNESKSFQTFTQVKTEEKFKSFETLESVGKQKLSQGKNLKTRFNPKHPNYERLSRTTKSKTDNHTYLKNTDNRSKSINESHKNEPQIQTKVKIDLNLKRNKTGNIEFHALNQKHQTKISKHEQKIREQITVKSFDNIQNSQAIGKKEKPTLKNENSIKAETIKPSSSRKKIKQVINNTVSIKNKKLETNIKHSKQVQIQDKQPENYEMNFIPVEPKKITSEKADRSEPQIKTETVQNQDTPLIEQTSGNDTPDSNFDFISETGDTAEFHQNETPDNQFEQHLNKNNYNLNLKMNNISLNINLRNQILNMVINLNNNLLSNNSDLNNEIKSILTESGFKNFNIVIRDKNKKAVISSEKIYTSTAKTRIKEREIDVKV